MTSSPVRVAVAAIATARRGQRIIIARVHWLAGDAGTPVAVAAYGRSLEVAMLKLYGCPNTRSMRVAWALEEAGVEYDYEAVILRKGEGRRLSFLRVNPSGKVPVLVDGDLVLTESAAICTYVGDCFPASGLTPGFGTADRARYNQWLAFAISELEQPLWTLAKHRFALPQELRVPAVEEAAKWEFGRACRVLEKGLGDNAFILGDRFTAADIMLSHILAWATSARIPVDSDLLRAYADRLLSRPALDRALEREQMVAA